MPFGYLKRRLSSFQEKFQMSQRNDSAPLGISHDIQVSSRERKKSERQGLHNHRAIFFLIMWYLFSASTLFLNKYILSYQHLDAYFLCAIQMFVTMLCGLFQLKFPLGLFSSVSGQRKPPKFYSKMAILGTLQLGTVLFSLIAIFYVAVSFAETVKSSAPIFTVIIARLYLGEKTSLRVLVTLLPVMMGLALCSSHELSFNIMGFLFSMATNLCECLQSVVSKAMLSDKTYIYSPAELQFYPNLVAVFLQLVLWIFFVDIPKLLNNLSVKVLLTSILDGVSFYGQTITAYILMSYINPVTYSVANTTKRALLIWASILVFHNVVTFFSGLGTLIVVIGVLCYAKARDAEARMRQHFSMAEDVLADVR